MTLRRARRQARLTKTALAQRVGLHRLTIARLENNETRPLHETVVALEEALGCALRFPRQSRRAA